MMMPWTWRRFLGGLVLVLAGGTLIGWLYGQAHLGFTLACVAALVWQVRHMLKFEQALHTRNFDYFRLGEGIWSTIYSHVSHLRQRNRQHKSNYRQLLREVRELTNALPYGGIVLGAANEIVLCNAAAQELAGFDTRQDRGQRVDNILRDPEFARYLSAGDYGSGIEVPSPVRQGAWLYCRLVPYGADQKLLLIHDVTERRRLSTLRREFVANASHELRSPLTVISGYLDTLADDQDAPHQWRKPLARMREQAIRMNRILKDLLELSRLEAKGSVVDEEHVDVSGLLSKIADEYAADPSAPPVDVQAESSAKLSGSPAEIESLIRNLVSNAVRHTPPEGTVKLAWHAGTAGAQLTVTDSGEGIAEEFIPRLTERFFRVDPGRSRDDGGVGLGLAIVKHVLSRHDAKLEIDSELGSGSSFTCRFPPERVFTTSAAPEQRATGL